METSFESKLLAINQAFNAKKNKHAVIQEMQLVDKQKLFLLLADKKGFKKILRRTIYSAFLAGLANFDFTDNKVKLIRELLPNESNNVDIGIFKNDPSEESHGLLKHAICGEWTTLKSLFKAHLKSLVARLIIDCKTDIETKATIQSIFLCSDALVETGYSTFFVAKKVLPNAVVGEDFKTGVRSALKAALDKFRVQQIGGPKDPVGQALVEFCKRINVDRIAVISEAFNVPVVEVARQV